MTARVVPLESDDAGDARVAGSAAERLAILAEPNDLIANKKASGRDRTERM